MNLTAYICSWSYRILLYNGLVDTRSGYDHTQRSPSFNSSQQSHISHGLLPRLYQDYKDSVRDGPAIRRSLHQYSATTRRLQLLHQVFGCGPPQHSFSRGDPGMAVIPIRLDRGLSLTLILERGSRVPRAPCDGDPVHPPHMRNRYHRPLHLTHLITSSVLPD
jgi:hypothetical protein